MPSQFKSSLSQPVALYALKVYCVLCVKPVRLTLFVPALTDVHCAPLQSCSYHQAFVWLAMMRVPVAAVGALPDVSVIVAGVGNAAAAAISLLYKQSLYTMHMYEVLAFKFVRLTEVVVTGLD